MTRELLKALAGNTGYVAELSGEDHRLLDNAKPQRLTFEKGAVIFREGDPANHFLLVESGVCFNHRHLEDGSRQVIDLYFPGEVVALGELSGVVHSSGLTTFLSAIILAYDKAEMQDRFSRSPALSRLFMDLISQEQAALTDRLVGIARHCARQRVARFLIEMYARSSRAFRLYSGSCALPGKISPAAPGGRQGPYLVDIPQVLIADTLGLSVVHVNRVLRQFREEGLLRTQSQGIELLNVSVLEEVAGWAGEPLKPPPSCALP